MSTKYIASNWRLPNQENSSKSDNYGLTFDGSEFINIDLSININSFSVSCWFKGNNLHTGAQKRLFDFADSTRTLNKFPILFTGSSAYATIGSGKIAVLDYSGSVGSISADWPTDRNGEWNHIVLLVNNTSVELYLNGSSLVSGTITRDTSYQDMTKFVIGSAANTTQYYFNGSISQLSVFDYVLSSTQISTLYGSSSLGAGNPMALKPQPVAYYPLGDNSASNPLTQPNEAVEDASVFDFSSDYIEILDNNNFDFGTNDFTISAWFKTSVTPSQHQTILSKQNPENSSEWVLQVLRSDNKLSFRTNGVDIVKSTTTVNDGNWNNVIITRVSGVFNLYLNSSQEDTTTSNQNLTNTENLRIGHRNSVYNAYFDGELSNIAIWNSDQSSEISNIYNSGVPATSYTNTPTAWYKLDQSANWEADSSGDWQIPDNRSAYPQSFSFNSASSNYIDCGSFSTLNSATAVTVSAWFKSSTYSNYGRVLSSQHIEIYQAASAYPNTQGRFYYRLRGNFGNQFALLGGTSDSGVGNLVDGNWHHLCVTFDNSTTTAVVYEDGVPVLTNTSVSGTLNSASSNLYIGSSSASTHFIDGSISNISIFNTALPATGTDSVETLYNNGSPLTTAIATDNLKAWYKLDNTATFSTNWSVPDASGNGNTGTSSGMTEQNLVNNNVSVLNGESSGMTSANLVLSDLTRAVPYDSYSFEFDGSDYIETPPTSFLNGLTNASWSFWIKPTDDASTRVIMHTQKDGASNKNSQFFFWMLKGNRLDFSISIESFYIRGDINYINYDEWNHLCVTFDGTGSLPYTGNMYINGVDRTTATYLYSTLPTARTDVNTRIGEIQEAGGYPYYNPFLGNMSQISIFDETLTSTEVLKLYSNGVPQDLANFNPQPVAWWPLGSNSFWNGSAWTVRDMIGSNDGTGQNIGIDGLVGDSPRSSANGVGTNNSIPENLEGSTKWSENNSWSINMSETARVEDTP